MRDQRADRRGGVRLRWVEWLLVGAGVAMLAWCALVVFDAMVSQHSARRSLETVTAPGPPVTVAEPEGTTGVVAAPVPVVVTGSAVGAITIPRVRLSAVVLHGSDERTLRRGPGHLEGTPLPGETGNTVIAGHRDSFFWPLRHVKVGDDVFIDTASGRFQYRVRSLRVVHPRDLSVLDATEDAVLTLITCYPFWVLGNAPDRFVVRATRVLDPAADHGYVGVESRVAHTDDELVREAVDRFREAYNGRLVSHKDPGTPLRRPTCDVVIDEQHATARCGAPATQAGDSRPQAWTVTLRRAAGRWAIGSVSMTQ